MTSAIEVRRNLGNFLVHHPGFSAVEAEVFDLIGRGKSEDEADCLLITGPSGTGKSTLRKLIKRANKPKGRRRRLRLPASPTVIYARRVPVVVMEMPSQPRPSSFVRELLAAFGDEFASKGRFDERSVRLDHLLEACGTTTIVIDEMQRLVDNSGEITSGAVLEELKRLHGKHGVSLIFLGLGRVRHIFEKDPQLNDRWSIELRLDRFKCFEAQLTPRGSTIVRRDEDWRNWRGVLQSLQADTGLRSFVPLSDPELATRLFYATGGVMRRLKNLLKRALTQADRLKAEELSLELLASAFAVQRRGSANPFGADYPDNVALPAIEDDYVLRPFAKRRKASKARKFKPELAEPHQLPGLTIVDALERLHG